MAYEVKPGTGSLWPARERKSERHPNYTGDMVCPCCEAKLWLSGWVKDHQGKKWLSLSANEKDKDKAPAKPVAAGKDDLDDDILF